MHAEIIIALRLPVCAIYPRVLSEHVVNKTLHHSKGCAQQAGTHQGSSEAPWAEKRRVSAGLIGEILLQVWKLFLGGGEEDTEPPSTPPKHVSLGFPPFVLSWT